MPSTTSSRRFILGALAAIPAATIAAVAPPVVQPESGAAAAQAIADPIFSAIEAHRAANKRYLESMVDVWIAEEAVDEGAGKRGIRKLRQNFRAARLREQE